MNIQIATAPCSWGVFFPDGRTSGTPYEVFLSQAHEAGYQEIELGPDGYLPQDVNILREKLQQYSLSVCGGTATIPFALMSKKECCGAVDMLAQRLVILGCTNMVVMDGSNYNQLLGSKAQWSENTWDTIYKNIAAVNDYLRQMYGVRMVFHPHAGTAIEYTAEIERMLSESKVYLCFDTGHHTFTNGGEKKGDSSALNFIRTYRDHISYLHFKNVDGSILKRAREEKWGIMQSFMNQVMCDLEDGIVDFEQLRDLLNEIGFEGPAIIEQDMFKVTTDFAFRTAKKNLQYLRRINMIS